MNYYNGTIAKYSKKTIEAVLDKSMEMIAEYLSGHEGKVMLNGKEGEVMLNGQGGEVKPLWARRKSKGLVDIGKRGECKILKES